MAACTTYFDIAHGWNARVAEHNAALLAQQPMRRRGARTPEVNFAKHFDNSRLVKAPDPVRMRQMRIFSAAVTRALFARDDLWLAALLRHRGLLSRRVGEADPGSAPRRESPVAPQRSGTGSARPHRRMARQMGLAAPQPGQVVHATARPETSAPVLAQITPPPPPAQ